MYALNISYLFALQEETPDDHLSCARKPTFRVPEAVERNVKGGNCTVCAASVYGEEW